MPNKVGDYTKYGFDNKGKKTPDARQTTQAPDYQNTLDTQAGIDFISGSQIGAGRLGSEIEFGSKNFYFDVKNNRLVIRDEQGLDNIWIGNIGK